MEKTFKITLLDELNQELKNLIEYIQQEHKEKVLDIYDLYDSLYINGSCSSYNKTRIYYTAFTLAANNIDFTIE